MYFMSQRRGGGREWIARTLRRPTHITTTERWERERERERATLPPRIPNDMIKQNFRNVVGGRFFASLYREDNLQSHCRRGTSIQQSRYCFNVNTDRSAPFVLSYCYCRVCLSNCVCDYEMIHIALPNSNKELTTNITNSKSGSSSPPSIENTCLR